MARRKETERIFVHKDFKKTLKAEAALRGYPSLIEFSKARAKEDLQRLSRIIAVEKPQKLVQKKRRNFGDDFVF